MTDPSTAGYPACEEPCSLRQEAAVTRGWNPQKGNPMPALDIILDGDNAWPDLRDKQFEEADLQGICILDAGMESGKPSVAIRFRLPDGRVAIGQTSLVLLLIAADAFKARYGDPRYE